MIFKGTFKKILNIKSCYSFEITRSRFINEKDDKKRFQIEVKCSKSLFTADRWREIRGDKRLCFVVFFCIFLQ